MKKTRYFLLFIFFLLFDKSFGQSFNQAQIDSLLLVAEQLEIKDAPYGVTLSLKAYDDSKKIGYKKGMTQGLLIASRKQHELAKYEDVLKNATAAEKLAVEISDAKLISDALRLKGIGYTGSGDYEKGLAQFRQSLHFAQTLTDKEVKSSRLGVLYNDIAFNLDENGGKADSVAFYYRKGYQEFQKMVLNNPLRNKTLSLACSNVGSSFLRAKELDSAEFYLDRALQLANSVNHEAVKANTLSDLGNLNYYRKKYKQSIDYFEKGIGVAKTINDTYTLKSLYLGMSKSYEAIRDSKNAESYLQLYNKLNDSIKKNQKESSPMQTASIEGRGVVTDADRSSNRSIIFSAIFVLLLVVILIHIYRKFQKEKANNARLQAEVEDTITMFTLLQKDEAHLKKILHLASTNDPSFLMLFKETYPDFYKKLNKINPGLIAGEQKLCAFLKLDFSTKEIAQYTNSSIRAVEAKKYRLRKKLSITSDEDINVWMMNL
ncbi:tetratricopeptide (TPR) repeat protein [Flavobacterium sp. 28YEA47A]|uniref:transcriptional regulator n=1 Tax=Flavobacterium sp. 28YEA47A TaxID=3156276 RepID=UPI003518D8C0